MTKRPDTKGFSCMALAVATCFSLTVGCTNTFGPAEPIDGSPAPRDGSRTDVDAGIPDLPDDGGPVPTEAGDASGSA